MLPDFTQTIWHNVENRLGRKLNPTENEGLSITSGMFKEWFFNSLSSLSNEEIERIVDHKANYVHGWANRPDKPERKGMKMPVRINIPKKSFWQRIVNMVID